MGAELELVPLQMPEYDNRIYKLASYGNTLFVKSRVEYTFAEKLFPSIFKRGKREMLIRFCFFRKNKSK